MNITIHKPQSMDFTTIKNKLDSKDVALEMVRMNGRKYSGNIEEIPDPSQRKTAIYLEKKSGGNEVFYYEW